MVSKVQLVLCGLSTRINPTFGKRKMDQIKVFPGLMTNWLLIKMNGRNPTLPRGLLITNDPFIPHYIKSTHTQAQF